MEIDWLSAESHVLLNPRMPREEELRLRSLVIELPAHIWLATSGTSGSLKLTALSKRALLASAAAVNRHLHAGPYDVWCCVLPTFHVGGLGIHARAFLSGSRVITAIWDAHQFAKLSDVTLVSLVPTQVSDLVRAGLTAPKNLRAIVVGGGALSDELYRAARELGWPLLPSYGMTECGSQVATATLASPELVLLDHVQVRITDGLIALRGDSLLTGYGTESGFIDPRVDGWLLTEDYGAVEGRVLRVEGRRGDFVKIGGESVDLARLDAIAGPHAAVVAVRDDRLGHVIHLVVDASVDAKTAAAEYDARVHPFERARRVYEVPEIPRSSLGKVIRGKLAELIPTVLE